MKKYFIISFSVFVLCLIAIGFFSDIISRSDFGAFLVIACAAISLICWPIFFTKWAELKIRQRNALDVNAPSHKTTAWRSDWVPITEPSERAQLNVELTKEITREHLLAAISANAIARRLSHDDVLYELSDGRFAEVHLSWAVETSPNWPATRIYENFAAWLDSADDD